jgi:tetratricopeptide (TPR) repeat protein
VNQEEIRHKIDSLMEQKNFSEILNLLQRMEKQRELTPGELVIKGRCIQLGPDDGEWDLKDSEEAFKKALAIEPDYLPALTELGFFYYAIEDDSVQALPFFRRAVEIARLDLTEAATGMAGCLEERQSQDVASDFLGDLHCGALVEEKLDEEKREWLRQVLQARKLGLER